MRPSTPTGPSRPGSGRWWTCWSRPARRPATSCAHMLRLEVVHVAFTGVSDVPEQAVELVQVSSLRAELVTGVQLHHFGAFYRESWRANDWLRGRVDGCAQVVQMLLAPERLRQLGLTAEEAQPAAAVGRRRSGRHRPAHPAGRGLGRRGRRADRRARGRGGRRPPPPHVPADRGADRPPHQHRVPARRARLPRDRRPRGTRPRGPRRPVGHARPRRPAAPRRRRQRRRPRGAARAPAGQRGGRPPDRRPGGRTWLGHLRADRHPRDGHADRDGVVGCRSRRRRSAC